jgi:hypothetical protein
MTEITYASGFKLSRSGPYHFDPTVQLQSQKDRNRKTTLKQRFAH